MRAMSPAAPPSPLATPRPWDLVADGYVAENVDHFTHYAHDALRLAGLAPGARVLDVAAGPGTLALVAARTAAHVDAIDFSAQMIAHLRAQAARTGVENVAAREGDGQALPYPDASFDAAFSMFGLMFFPDRARGFAELHRVLVPGGRAVVSSWHPMDKVPLFSMLMGALVAQLPAMPAPQGKGPLADPDDFRDEMHAAGFQDVRVHEVTHTDEWVDRDALWRALQISFAPLVLMKQNLGEAAFAPIARAVHATIEREVPMGPVRVSMPAWLGVGSK